MIGRVLAFVAATLAIVWLGYYAVFFASLGACGMGPDAQQACYDGQAPWVYATVAVFVAIEAAAAFLIFRRTKGR